jgi:DNA-binding HxlR family transcriptional regulator
MLDSKDAAIGGLKAVAHHRWMIPVLAECAGSPGGGCKYVTFIVRLQLSRDALGRTLEAGLANGWLMHNPGVGHPLRPEYVLTAHGRLVAQPARRVMRTLRRMDLLELGLMKWSLPVLCALAANQKTRFGDLARALSGSTNRAISLTLRDLEGAELVVRDVQATYPPTTQYALSTRARRLAKLARALGEAAAHRRVRPQPADDRRRQKSA